MNVPLPVLVALACCLASPAGAHPGAHETLEYLSARIEQAPGSAALHYQRGVAYSLDGQYPQAISDLRQAADFGQSQLAEFQLGLTYYRMDNLLAARRCFDAYLAAEPQDIPALQYRAKVLERLGDKAGALRDYEKIFEQPGRIDPTDYLAASSLALEIPPQNEDAAIALLDKGIQRLGVVPQLQRRAIEFELILGRYGRAINRQQSLAGDAARGPFWQVQMGQLLIAAGQAERAWQHFAVADRQLAVLRKTPARAQLSQELQSLLAQRPGA